MQKDMKKILLENLLNQLWKEGCACPERMIRNFIDLGVACSKGKVPKGFFTYVQEILQNSRSAYYQLIREVTDHVEQEILLTLGLNIGYYGCMQGVPRIREMQKAQGKKIPWALRLWTDEKALSYDNCKEEVAKGKKKGIYTYLLFVKKETKEKILSLLHTYEDCSFFLFFKDAGLSDSFLNEIKKCKNAVISVCMDQTAEADCRRFRRMGLLYGIYKVYQKEDAEKWMEHTRRRQKDSWYPHFVFLWANSSCPLEIRQKMGERVSDLRKKGKIPTLLIEVEQDLKKINEMVQESPR